MGHTLRLQIYKVFLNERNKIPQNLKMTVVPTECVAISLVICGILIVGIRALWRLLYREGREMLFAFDTIFVISWLILNYPRWRRLKRYLRAAVCGP